MIRRPKSLLSYLFQTIAEVEKEVVDDHVSLDDNENIQTTEIPSEKYVYMLIFDQKYVYLLIFDQYQHIYVFLINNWY